MAGGNQYQKSLPAGEVARTASRRGAERKLAAEAASTLPRAYLCAPFHHCVVPLPQGGGLACD